MCSASRSPPPGAPSICSSGTAQSSKTTSAVSLLRTPSLSSCFPTRSEEHTSELQSRLHLVCRLLLEKKKKIYQEHNCVPEYTKSKICTHDSAPPHTLRMPYIQV